MEGGDENHTPGMYYSDHVPVLIKAIHEQHGQLEELKNLPESGEKENEEL